MFSFHLNSFREALIEPDNWQVFLIFIYSPELVLVDCQRVSIYNQGQ